MDNRATSTLFDTPRLVRDLENLFRQMWADAVAGRVEKPDFTNLPAYFEIGLDLAISGFAPATREDVAQAYRARLAERAVWERVPPDARLWRG